MHKPYGRFKYLIHLLPLALRRVVAGMRPDEYETCRQILAAKYIPGVERPQVVGPFSWGDEHPDRKFLVIRRRDLAAGLFSHFQTNLAWMRFAEEHGLTPVVDMKTAENLYRGKSREVNPWEIFFKQAEGFRLKDIARAKTVYVTGNRQPEAPGLKMASFTVAALMIWRQIAHRHAQLTEEILDEVQTVERRLFAGKKVLGVLLRGTDYLALRPPGHPIQPTIELALERVATRVREGGFDLVFLVTEDATIVESFRRAFGDRLRMTDQEPIDYRGKGYIASRKEVRGDLKRAHDYLVRIAILSRCKSVICGRTSGSLGAAILSEGFEESYFWDLGTYPEKQTEEK